MGLRIEGTARPLRSISSGNCCWDWEVCCCCTCWPFLFGSGTHLVARECHFSFGSPSRKLLSAHLGCGLPMHDKKTKNKKKKDERKINNWTVDINSTHNGWAIVPRSSRTKDSNSAILFRRRVLSSSDGSSLERKKKKKKQVNLLFSWGGASSG